MAIASLGGIGWQLAGIVVPVVIGWTIDHGIEAEDRSNVWLGGMVLVALGVVEAAGAAIRHRMACTALLDSSRDLRHALTDAALGLDDDGRSAFPAGEVVARETSDTDTVGGLLDAFGHTLAEALSIPIILGALLLIDPVLALVVGIVVPVSAIVTWRYSAVWERRGAVAQAAMGETVERAQETVEGFKVIRGMGAEDAVVARFEEASDELRARSTDLGRLWLVFEPLIEALSVVSVVAVLWIGGNRVIDGSVDLGGVVTAVGFVLFLAGPVRTVGTRILTLQAALASADRIVALLDAAPPARATGPDPLTGEDGLALETTGLVVGRRGRAAEALVHGDLAVPAGSLVVLDGATGSGKSTLLAVLAGLRTPLAGAVRLGGVDITEWPTEALHRRVLLCGPVPFVFSGSIQENLRFAARDASDDELRAALDAAQLLPSIDELPDGLATVTGERGVTLSGGQRQRLALARAVLARPAVLLLDGATSALDHATEEAVLDGLRHALPTTSIVVVTANRRIKAKAEHHVVVVDGTVRS